MPAIIRTMSKELNCAAAENSFINMIPGRELRIDGFESQCDNQGRLVSGLAKFFLKPAAEAWLGAWKPQLAASSYGQGIWS